MNDELVRKIEILLSDKLEKNIPCCEDSTHDYDAYNNIANMYQTSSEKYGDITVFNEYINMSFEALALKLDVDPTSFKGLFSSHHVPSKGLACAIGMALGLSYDDIIDILAKLGYSFNNSDYDRIIRYFIQNKIYDVNELNEVLLHFGQMYLYSKRKLR